MNTEKLEKLKKSLDNQFVPDNMKDKIRAEIKKIEAEIEKESKSTSEINKEIKEVEKKVEEAIEKGEEKAEEKAEPKKRRGRPAKVKETPAEPKATETTIKKTAMAVAKSIRKDGEKWSDAMKRANEVMNKEKVEAKKTTKSELNRLLARVRKNKSLMSELSGVKDLSRDAVRKAKPVGKRISKTGNVYYEYRANKTDRKTYGKYAFADGGEVEFVDKFTYKDGIQISEGKTENGKTFYFGSVASYPLYKFIPMNENKSYVVQRAKDIYKSMLNYKKTEDFKIYGAENFELGGSVVTDLAGHQDGTFGVGNHGMLDGFSNTSYTGLVGETGAMSSGELFMDGGAVGMANQQVIDNASQSYVNYYLGEGASAGIFAKGGAIKNQYAGRTPEDVWNSLTIEQRKHFLKDHRVLMSLSDDYRASLYRYDELPKDLLSKIEPKFTEHIKEGQYAKGGGVSKYVRAYYNESISNDDNGYQVNLMFYNNQDDDDYFDEEFITTNSPKEAEALADKINEEGYEIFIPKDKFAKGGSINDKTTKMRKQRLKKGDNVFVIGRRWFDRVNGNTYHTAEVEVNGIYVGKSRMTYGYGDYYLETAKEILLQKYDFPKGMNENSPLWQLREYGVVLNKSVIDGKKRDLEAGGFMDGVYAEGGGVRIVNGREYPTGRNWTNEHRHIDKADEREVNYVRKKSFAHGGGVDYVPQRIQERLEYLRGEIRKEDISYDEIVELESLREYIAPDDVELLQWVDVEENEFAKGGKVSPFKNIMETNTITEKEINLIKLRMNNNKVDEDTQEIIDYIWENSPQLTPDQNKKGIDYLRNLWKSPTGKERANNPFGYREQEALETFEYFELRGFYDAGNIYHKFYVPLYICVGAETSFEYYISGGQINIVG